MKIAHAGGQRALWPLLFAAMLWSSAASAADPIRTEYELSAVGTLEIATDGTVSDYRLTSELNPKIAAMVDRSVREWHFEPILVDGRAVNARTKLRVRLTATPVERGYALKVAQVGFGEPERIQNLRPPRYPESAIQARLNAKVVLALHLDDQGKVIEAHPYQTSLAAHAKSERLAEQWRREFERRSIAAAMNWKLEPSESVDGKKTSPSVVMMAIEFKMGSRFEKPVWQAYEPGPIQPLPPAWRGPGPGTGLSGPQLAEMKEGDLRSMDSRFRLKEEVVGRTL